MIHKYEMDSMNPLSLSVSISLYPSIKLVPNFKPRISNPSDLFHYDHSDSAARCVIQKSCTLKFVTFTRLEA